MLPGGSPELSDPSGSSWEPLRRLFGALRSSPELSGALMSSSEIPGGLQRSLRSTPVSANWPRGWPKPACSN
eukprot:10368418-Alexandrium_andersonii.AAC.1